MSLTIKRGGLTITFYYHPAELPCWDPERPYPGCPEEVEVESVILETQGKIVDLLDVLTGHPYDVILEWAESVALQHVREQRDHDSHDPD